MNSDRVYRGRWAAFPRIPVLAKRKRVLSRMARFVSKLLIFKEVLRFLGRFITVQSRFSKCRHSNYIFKRTTIHIDLSPSGERKEIDAILAAGHREEVGEFCEYGRTDVEGQTLRQSAHPRTAGSAAEEVVHPTDQRGRPPRYARSHYRILHAFRRGEIPTFHLSQL